MEKNKCVIEHKDILCEEIKRRKNGCCKSNN